MELLELANLDPAKGSSVKAAKLRIHAPEVLPVRGQLEVEWPQSASLAPLANHSDEHATKTAATARTGLPSTRW